MRVTGQAKLSESSPSQYRSKVLQNWKDLLRSTGGVCNTLLGVLVANPNNIADMLGYALDTAIGRDASIAIAAAAAAAAAPASRPGTPSEMGAAGLAAASFFCTRKAFRAQSVLWLRC